MRPSKPTFENIFLCQKPKSATILPSLLKQKPRKEQILEVASALFRKKGYQATSVRMIAAGLGMEASSLYNHISSKQEILRELLLNTAELFTAGLSEIEQSPKNIFEKLESLVALHIQLTLEFPNQISLITGEWVHLEEPALQQYIKLRNEYEHRFKSIISQGMKEEYLDQMDVDIALFSILSTLHWLYSWVGRHKNIDRADLEIQMKKCLLTGLKKR
jgi:AcrR family transcriptional regulator